jgi:hypothetical protein
MRYRVNLDVTVDLDASDPDAARELAGQSIQRSDEGWLNIEVKTVEILPDEEDEE